MSQPCQYFTPSKLGKWEASYWLVIMYNIKARITFRVNVRYPLLEEDVYGANVAFI